MTSEICAILFAAGRGERLRPLTDNTPKPLIDIKGFPIIKNIIDSLYIAGIRKYYINLGWLAEDLHIAIQDLVSHLSIQVVYSYEGWPALETGGAIIKVADFIDNKFLAVNCDIITDFDFDLLLEKTKNMQSLAHLICVPNPEHNINGDFILNVPHETLFKKENNIYNDSDDLLSVTFAGIGIYQKKLFYSYKNQCHIKLANILKENLDNISAELFKGLWIDIGTPQRLEQARQHD